MRVGDKVRILKGHPAAGLVHIVFKVDDKHASDLFVVKEWWPRKKRWNYSCKYGWELQMYIDKGIATLIKGT